MHLKEKETLFFKHLCIDLMEILTSKCSLSKLKKCFLPAHASSPFFFPIPQSPFPSIIYQRCVALILGGPNFS